MIAVVAIAMGIHFLMLPGAVLGPLGFFYKTEPELRNTPEFSRKLEELSNRGDTHLLISGMLCVGITVFATVVFFKRLTDLRKRKSARKIKPIDRD